MNAGDDDMHVTYREHIAAKEEAAKKMAALELEQAAQRAALMHLPEDVRQLTSAVNGLASKIPAVLPTTGADHQADQTSLAVHRLVDHLAKQPPAASNVKDIIELLDKRTANGAVLPWMICGVAAAGAALLFWQKITGGG